jgi:IS4 transposase
LSKALGLPESDVKTILDLVKRLREEEKRVIEELKEFRRYYYLGYLPVTCRVRVNV